MEKKYSKLKGNKRLLYRQMWNYNEKYKFLVEDVFADIAGKEGLSTWEINKFNSFFSHNDVNFRFN